MARTYYVSPSGSDSASGAEDAPFKTIKRGTRALSSGDTLLVMNGTYVETVDIGTAGTAALPTTVKAYPGHTPIIDGRAGEGGINNGLPTGEIIKKNPDTGAGFNWGGLLDVTASHVLVEGFEIRNSMGRGMRVYSPDDRALTNVVIRNCNVHHSRNTNILIQGTYQQNGRYTVTNITVEDCSVSWSGNYYPARRAANAATDWAASIAITGAETCAVRRCEIFNNWGETVIADANEGQARDILIEDNIFYDNFKSCFLHAVDNAVFQRNYMYRSATDKNRANAFGPSIGLGLVAAEQTFYEQIATTNVRILNNIIVDASTGLSIRGSDNRAENANFLIAHNTVVNSTGQGVSATVVNKRNILFVNNMVVGKPGQTLVYDPEGQTRSDWTYYNNFWSSRPDRLYSGSDVVGNPELVGIDFDPLPGQGDPTKYQLTKSSAAVDQGAALTAVQEDFFRSARAGKNDIGAHELVREPVKADFSAVPTDGDAPLVVSFKDKSTAPEPISGWLWDFGDGTVSNQQNPTHSYSAGTYTVSLRVASSAGSHIVTKSGLITAEVVTVNSLPRVTDGIQALYRFDQRSGNRIYDVSGEGVPLDLIINDPAKVQWTSQGLSILESTIIASNGPAEKLNEACRSSNEITLEVWCAPANKNQDGPARLVSLSQNVHSRNLTLGQGLWGSQPSDLYDVRLRTTERSANGMPSFSTPAGSLTREMTHVVFTRNSSGLARLHLNGVVVSETNIPGDLSTWNPRFPLLLGNETTGEYPWLGQVFLVAVYDRFLTRAEVRQNFRAGIGAPAREPASVQLSSFKRFVLVSNGSIRQGTTAVAYGIQYPDQRCVVCPGSGNNGMTIYKDVNRVLRTYAEPGIKLEWLD